MNSRVRSTPARGARLVPLLGLQVVEDQRQVAVRAHLARDVEGDRLLVRHRQHQGPLGAVLELEQLGISLRPVRSQLSRLEHRHQHLAGRRSRPSPHAGSARRAGARATRRQEGPHPGAQLAHQAGAHHQHVRERLRVGGRVLQRRQEIAGKAGHGERRCYRGPARHPGGCPPIYSDARRAGFNHREADESLSRRARPNALAPPRMAQASTSRWATRGFGFGPVPSETATWPAEQSSVGVRLLPPTTRSRRCAARLEQHAVPAHHPSYREPPPRCAARGRNSNSNPRDNVEVDSASAATTSQPDHRCVPGGHLRMPEHDRERVRRLPRRPRPGPGRRCAPRPVPTRGSCSDLRQRSSRLPRASDPAAPTARRHGARGRRLRRPGAHDIMRDVAADYDVEIAEVRRPRSADWVGGNTPAPGDSGYVKVAAAFAEVLRTVVRRPLAKTPGGVPRSGAGPLRLRARRYLFPARLFRPWTWPTRAGQQHGSPALRLPDRACGVDRAPGRRDAVRGALYANGPSGRFMLDGEWYRRADPLAAARRGGWQRSPSLRGWRTTTVPMPPTPATSPRAATWAACGGTARTSGARRRGDRLGAALRVGQLPRDRLAERPPHRQPHRRLPAVRGRGAGLRRRAEPARRARGQPPRRAAVPPHRPPPRRPLRRRLVELRRHPARGLPAPGRHGRPRERPRLRRAARATPATPGSTCAPWRPTSRASRWTPTLTGTRRRPQAGLQARRDPPGAASICSAAAP